MYFIFVEYVVYLFFLAYSTASEQPYRGMSCHSPQDDDALWQCTIDSSNYHCPQKTHSHHWHDCLSILNFAFYFSHFFRLLFGFLLYFFFCFSLFFVLVINLICLSRSHLIGRHVYFHHWQDYLFMIYYFIIVHVEYIVVMSCCYN